ncbi:MAG: anthranilate synthase component I family protein [Deltaproteobacteria bacterium]|jgi:anthranilate synthase component 1|nr:anthranilate synthase component I family protein [Deltaproteobacteria bacterium]
MIVLTQKAAPLSNDLATPISVFLEKVGPRGSGVLLESAEVGGRWGRHSVIAAGVLLKLSVRAGLLEVETAAESLAPLKKFAGLPYLTGLQKVLASLTVRPDPAAPNLPTITRALYGYLGHDAVSLAEESLIPYLPPARAESAFILPASVFLFDHAFGKLTELKLPGEPLKLEPLPLEAKGGGRQTSPSREEYMELVRQARDLIGEGELIQLVLSVALDEPFAGAPLNLYRALRRLNPSPYMFHMQLPELALVVSSPEVLVSSAGDGLKLCPIAGTRPRGDTSAEDNLFEAELVQNEKERAEHVMLVDLGRNDLGKVATPSSVEVERFMDVERFSHVMHLTSHLKATLKPGLDAIDVLKATFPAGTVSGAPKIRALELISRMETSPRGPYAGGVGWFGLDKGSVDLDFGITIRSAWIREGRVHCRAGAGIVFDSDPLSEWKECLAKLAALTQALDEHRALEVSQNAASN